MEKRQLLELKGSVEEIIYRNENNGYSVLNVLCDGINTTAVGNMSDVSVGDELRLVGNWKNHPSYGEQFSFEYYEQFMPSTGESVLKYLSSGTIKGIGRATAKRLVDAFGENTLEVMRDEPMRLVEIRGISEAKAMALSEEVRKSFGMREVMVYLEKFKISAREAVRVWKALGTGAVALIEENPYILCSNNIDIPFDRADMIAASFDKPEDDAFRIRAGIYYIISYNCGNGHTCLPREKLIKVCADYLKLPNELIEDILAQMLIDGTLICDTIDNREFVFIPEMYRSETYAADRLLMLLKFPPQSIPGGRLALEAFEKQQGISYATLQRQAITEALSNGLLILTGGPGTGKTTTLNAIISLFMQSGLKVLLAAPTGRAAQRMSQVTGQDAKTIHRLLEVEWDKNDRPVFKRNDRNLLDCDALIIDELSMVDVSLFEGVMRALPPGCRLIMVGDSDQLPSVGAGNVLGDLIASGKIPVVQLTEIFRQSMKSLIVTNAHKIVHGEMPEIRRTDSDFFFMTCDSRERISSVIVELCSVRLPKTYGFSSFENIQVLCPGRKGTLGVTELNKALQSALNPQDKSKPQLVLPNYTFRVGDKVMQTKNNYELLWIKSDGSEGAGVYNGDIGIVEHIDKLSKSAIIRYDDKRVVYDTESLQNVELAYATTVHKSQGNEFDAVIMPMYYGSPRLYYRNLLYTAVTRAKKMLILVGNAPTLRKMVENNKKTLRYSGLRAFLERE